MLTPQFNNDGPGTVFFKPLETNCLKSPDNSYFDMVLSSCSIVYFIVYDFWFTCIRCYSTTLTKNSSPRVLEMTVYWLGERSDRVLYVYLFPNIRRLLFPPSLYSFLKHLISNRQSVFVGSPERFLLKFWVTHWQTVI